MYCIQVEYDPVSYGYPNVEQPGQALKVIC